VNFTISARKKGLTPIDIFIDKYYSEYKTNIKSVFGFSEYTPLYGGRPFIKEELNENDLKWMYSNGISYRIPLTNKYPNLKRYKESLSFLEKHHKEGNIIITSTLWLAKKIKKDFPKYKLESSVMFKPMSEIEITNLLKVFDSVVLPPMWYNRQDLKNLKNKDKLVWFTGCGCLFNCPDDACQRFFSNQIIGKKSNEPFCSMNYVERQLQGFNYFNINYLQSLGFSNFKVMREDEAIRKGPIKCLISKDFYIENKTHTLSFKHIKKINL